MFPHLSRWIKTCLVSTLYCQLQPHYACSIFSTADFKYHFHNYKNHTLIVYFGLAQAKQYKMFERPQCWQRYCSCISLYPVSFLEGSYTTNVVAYTFSLISTCSSKCWMKMDFGNLSIISHDTLRSRCMHCSSETLMWFSKMGTW